MMRFLPLLLLALTGLSPASTANGDPESRMAAVAAASPLIQDALRDDRAAAGALRDPALRRETLAALFDPDDCVRHRVGMDAAKQAAVLDALRARGWLAPSLSATQAHEAVFPPLRDGGTPCPRLPVTDLLAPGGDGVSHHSWPGGLALHVAFNIGSVRAQARLYAQKSQAPGIDTDSVVAAALWHDWAKALTLQWRPDGRLTPEGTIAGTGAHHILSLAEAMRRGFPPSQVVTQACAHGVDPARVADWIGAAALVAGVDATRYKVALTPECLVHHLSDQNWVFADAAITQADQILAMEAPRFGLADTENARYRLCYRNVALSDLGADRLFVASAGERRRLLEHLFGRATGCR